MGRAELTEDGWSAKERHLERMLNTMYPPGAAPTKDEVDMSTPEEVAARAAAADFDGYIVRMRVPEIQWPPPDIDEETNY